MNKGISAIVTTIALLFVIISGFIFRPVPQVMESECESISGKVIEILEAGEKDIIFILEGNEHKYYINRGLEQGLDLNTLQTKLLHQQVTLKYPKYWTPLDPNNNIRHLAKVESNNKIYFDETKK